ncbi:MAG: hypothetical protein LBM63_03020 [Rikenellaceae bacterium]|jgi:hypothetical protein|nr:hypothetical protein [Rikenellaceae bacterium]
MDENPTPITRAEVGEMIAEALSSLRIYVVEADITAAQQTVKTIVEQATF